MADNNPTLENQPRPDWLIANMQGALPKTLGGMHEQGIASSMFDIAPVDSYWASDKIRAAFKDQQTGKERKDLFDKYYKEQVDRYNSYRTGEHAILNYNNSPNVTAKRTQAKTPQAVIYKANPDPMGRSYSSITGYSGPEHSLREAAIKRGGKMTDGSYVNPDDYKGLMRFAREDNGEWKFDEGGHPYLEPFDQGKNLRQFDEVYNPTAKDWGYYGHSWDWTMLASSLIKNPINFFVSSVDALAEYPKSVIAAMKGGDQTDAYRGIVSAENWTKQFKIGNTDEGQSKFFSLENMTDLGQQVMYQLLSMRAIGKGVGSMTGSPEAGSVASKIYMVGLSAGPMADVSRDAGLSQRETALMLAATSAAFYPLMSLSEGAIGALATKDSQAAIKQMISPLGVAVKSGDKAKITASMLNLQNGIRNMAYNIEKTVPKNAYGKAIAGAGLEAIEETSEQVVDVGLRSLYNGYNAISQGSDLAQSLGTTKNKFEIDPVRELELMGQSAVGGAIGGSLASRLLSKWNNEDNEVARGIHDMVMDGKEKVFYDYIKNMHEAGRLDHSWTTAKGELAKPGDVTKNDQAYNILKGVGDYLVELRDNAGINELYKNNEAKAAGFKELLKSSSVGKDVAKLHADIMSLQDRLDKETVNKTPNKEQIAQTQAELQDKLEAMNKIKNGEFVTDYVMEGLYNLGAISGSRPDLNINQLSGKGFITLTNSINAIKDEENTATDQFNVNLGTGDATATLDNFQNISQTGKDRLINEGLVELTSKATALDGVATELKELSEQTGNELEIESLTSADPSIRTNEASFLRNSVLPLVTNQETKAKLEDYLSVADKLNKVETFEPLAPKTEPSAVDLLTRMTQNVGESTIPLSTPIATKIQNEFDLRKAQNKDGVSLYSNTPQLQTILKSINQRLAQIEGMKLMGPTINNFLMTRGKEKMAEFEASDLASAQNHLRNQQAIVMALVMESEENSRNSEARIREITSARILDQTKVLDNIALLSSGTEFKIFESWNKTREGVYKAIEANDFITANRLFMQMEDEINENYGSRKADILKALFNGKPLDVFGLQDAENSHLIESYNYMRGVLSLPASDFWNAYHSALNEADDKKPSPSWEQDMVIKRAVMSLSADNYNPAIIASHPNRVNHHSSVFIQGKGGTGKSAFVIPTVAAVYQEIYGGKVLLAATKDSRDSKRIKLVEDVKSFYPKLKTSSVSRALPEILADANLLKDVNLIVFDEATLLRSEDLAQANNWLVQINNSRKDAGLPTLKLLLTGDTLQNNADVDLNHPEVLPFGIDNGQRHVIDRVPQLKFSFRQGNQQLILMGNYLEKIQGESGKSDGFQAEYKVKKGTRIIGDQKEFVKVVASMFEDLKAKNELHRAVYITDKSTFDIDPRIVSTGASIMTSVEAQGEQWDIVVFDPKTKSLFSDHRNLAVKKDAYTAATRAREFFVASYPENSGLSSRDGAVNDIKPLDLSRFNKQTKLDEINNILGTEAQPVKKREARKDIHVIPDFDLFAKPPTTSVTPGAAQVVSSNEAPASRRYNKDLPDNLNDKFGELETRNPADSYVDDEPPMFEKPPVETTMGLVSKGDVVAKYIRENVKEGLIPLHTFFTDTTAKVLPDVLDKKRKALYDRSTIATAPYFITIARIGTAEYANVIRNNPNYNGHHAMFLEAEVEGTRVVIGAFQSNDFDKFITENNILGQSPKVSLPVSSSILAEAQALRPWVVKARNSEPKLGEIRKKSTGIQFGTPRVWRFKSSENNVNGDPKNKAGDIFVPVSFKYTPSDIDRVLNRNGSDEHIAFVQLRSVASPFKNSATLLEKYIKKGEDGKWKYNFSEEGGRMYDAFWGNLSNAKTSKAGKDKESILSRAFKDIYSTLPEGAYKTFMSKYAGSADPEIIEAGKQLKEAGAKVIGKGEGKNLSKSQANYFMANYLVAKNAGSQDLQLFERAITDLSANPAFKQGFDFDARIAYDSTLKEVPEHAQAQKLPSEVYDNMLKASVEYVSMPSLQVPVEAVANAIKKSFAIENVPSVSTSETGLVVNESPTDPDKPRNPDPFDQLGDMSLLGLYKRWFDKPGYITFLPDTITQFRRMMYDAIFSLNNPATGPRLREINDVIKEFREDYKQFKSKYPGDFLQSLDPINDDKARELYKTGVIYNEMPFLLRKYFPTIVKTKVTNEDGTQTEQYVYRSSHKKQTHFNEKESFNLLADGMTEMVKTQLYNTPLIQKTRSGFRKTGDFLNPSHIESLVKMVKGASTSEEVAEKLLDSGSDIGLSIYNRFYNPLSFKLDGVDTRSVGSIAHPEVRKMVDSVSLFALSGQVFDLASVDLDEMKFTLPNQTFGVPNILKELMHQAINSTAEELGEQIYSFDDGSYVINQIKVKPSNQQLPTEEDLVKAINAMGIMNFTKEVLQEMYLYDPVKLAVSPNQDEVKNQEQVRNQLMDVVVLPTIGEMMRDRQVRFTSRIGVIYDAVARNAGVKSTLSQRNIEGQIVNRLRYTAPLFRIGDRIQEIRDTVDSVVADNLIVKGVYDIIDTYVWEGIKSRDNSKSHKSMTADETMELDVLWGFAYTLNEDHKKGKKYDVTSFPAMVYSDSSTDVKFVVRSKEGYFRDTDKIADDLFNANKQYMNRLSLKILNWWNAVLAQSPIQLNATTLASLDGILAANPISSDGIGKIPGVIRNLYFIDKGGYARLKPSLVRDSIMYNSADGANTYKAKLEENYKKLLDRSKTITNAEGKTLYERMNKLVEDKSASGLLKSFYYNWVAFSQQLHLITNGPEYQYDDKGKDSESQEYIDLVKRAKLQISNRSHQIFRNKSWLAHWREAKVKGLEGTAIESLRYEGKKLPRVGRIAYVKDPVKALVNLVGETKMQEIYDGATFVSPLTRIMQFHSNAGEHGINTSPIMKNVTTYFNNDTGVNTSIKNAEFLITPEILRQGSSLPGRLVQRMLSAPFSKAVNGKNNAYELIQSLGVSPDFSNVEQKHFEQLMDILVDNEEQDSIILEVAPISSVKTGIGAVNEFDPAGINGQGDNSINESVTTDGPGLYVFEDIDLISKGTQLDASHDIHDIPRIKTPTQHINALAINAMNFDPAAVQRVLGGLSKIANLVNDEFEGKDDLELTERMKGFVAKAVGTKENISYLSEITDALNKNQYSLDDRQVINTFVRNFNAYLSDNAIMPEFEGGHFILHPSSGLLPIMEANGRKGLRSTFSPEEQKTGILRDLKWASPKRQADGKTLHQLIQEIYIGATASVTLADAIATVKVNPEVKAQVAQEIAALHATLGQGWDPGFAEVLLPAEMFKEFGIEDFNIQPSQITPQYFGQLLRVKNPKMDRQMLATKAIAMFESFQKRLTDVVARIPGTGKHSSVVTEVVGFMNESQNAVFAPPELIFVQGADQDIDKGSMMTFETIEGITAKIDENYQLMNGELFADKNKKKAMLAGIKNDIVSNFMKISSDPRSAVEANISVDSAMEEWKQLAARLENNARYSRYDFTSYAEMKEINQSGKNMVGIFANANKAYQIMYTAFKMAGIKDGTLAGLNEQFNTTWIKLAALINLSTDNAKLQVLGRLGIGEHNGNMVAYLIMKGASPTDIASFLEQYKPEMEQLKASRRYDEEGFFSPAEAWTDKTELASTYYMGEEIGTFARSIMNRGVPSGPDEMYSYIYNMNRAINRTYKRVGFTQDFDLMRFLSNTGIRNEQVMKYGKLHTMIDKSGIRYSEFNILQAVSGTPHIMSYLNTFRLSHDTVNKVSKAYKVTNSVIENLEEITIKPDYYRDVQDFTYGLFVHDFMRANKVKTDGYDLDTLPGREAFVYETASKEFIDTMKLKYPENSFVNSLSLEDHKRYGFMTRKRLRTYDLMQMIEEKLLRLRVDFESLRPQDREKLVNYHLIVDKGRISKGSFGQLFRPADLKDFTHFLSSIDSSKYDYKRLAELYYSYRNGGENSNVVHNAIPYTDTEFGSPRPTASANTEVQMSKPNSGIKLPAPIEAILTKYNTPIVSDLALDDYVSTLESLSRDSRLSDAESTMIRRVLNNYYKFVNDRSDSQTLQRIIDCT